MSVRFLQGCVLSRGADELSPESEERSGGSQPEHTGVYRDGEDAAGCEEPCSRGGGMRKNDEG